MDNQQEASKRTIMNAQDLEELDYMKCPICKEGYMHIDPWPEEQYEPNAEFTRTECFECDKCDSIVAVKDTYVLDRSKRSIEVVKKG